MIYDDTCEVVEIPSREWIKLAELNTVNQDVLRQRRIREQLRSMNEQEINYDEYFFEKTSKQKSELEKMKGVSEDEKERIINEDNNGGAEEEASPSLLTGILKVQTISEKNEFAHGFIVVLENVKNVATGDSEKDIKFDTREIYLNERNFTNSNLSIILKMNKVNEEKLNEIILKKKNKRRELNVKRYTEEITLSTQFYKLVFNNQNVTLLEIFKYFAKYERRKVIHFNNYFINNLTT